MNQADVDQATEPFVSIGRDSFYTEVDKYGVSRDAHALRKETIEQDPRR
jgi:hypothetical protein